MSSNAAKPPRWFQNWRSASRPAPDTDAADLGTAFGLDLSLSETAAASQPGKGSRAGWMQRLADRRRSAP